MNANGMFSPNLIALTRLRTYTCHSYLNIYYVFMNVWIFGQFVDVVCVFFLSFMSLNTKDCTQITYKQLKQIYAYGNCFTYNFMFIFICETKNAMTFF